MRIRRLIVVLASCVVATGAAGAARAAVLKVPQQFATINDAIAAAGSGDTVLVSKGTYDTNPFIDSKQNLTLRAKGKVTVRGVSAGDPGTIVVKNSSGIVVRGFRIEPNPLESGIGADTSTDCTFDKCRVTGGKNGFDFESTTGVVVISRCRSDSATSVGIIAAGADVTVEKCKVTHPGGDGIVVDAASSTVIGNKLSQIGDDGISLAKSVGGFVADNRLTDVVELAIGGSTSAAVLIGNHVKRAAVGVEANGGGVLIEDNDFKDVSVKAIAALGGGISTSRNHMTRCAIGIQVGGGASDSVHSQNVIKKSTGNGIELNAGATENLFVGNVVKQSDGFDLFDESGGANTFIANQFGTAGS